jgi:hypothetical protein
MSAEASLASVQQIYTYFRRGNVPGILEHLLDIVELNSHYPSKFIAHDDAVVALGFAGFTVKATGSVRHNEWAHIWTLADAKVVGCAPINDTATMSYAF